jgi:hypothetical protein
MTKTMKEIYECDMCGAEYDSESDYIRQCVICDDDFCQDCRDDHANEEAFGSWSR